ncbi:MAG TPA: hypothetical protein VFD92_27030 [Candidatus Binatia bacterium]|nr:hypothetical protein [Candidatus Binatia bacterium]
MEDRDLLRRMDENFVAAYREHTRHVDGGAVRERGSFTIFHVPLGDAMHNPILVHGPAALSDVLAAAEGRRHEIGERFTIVTRAHADEHLRPGLEAAGYLGLIATPGMALRRERWRAPEAVAPPGLEIRPVATLDDARAYGEVVAEAFSVYGVARAAVRSFFTRRESLAGDAVQGFLGWIDGVPVTAAALYVSGDVAGVGWVGTLPSFFGRRLAEAATARVVEEGFRRGLALANLQASPLGEKLYARMGFETPTRYNVFVPMPRSQGGGVAVK